MRNEIRYIIKVEVVDTRPRWLKFLDKLTKLPGNDSLLLVLLLGIPYFLATKLIDEEKYISRNVAIYRTKQLFLEEPSRVYREAIPKNIADYKLDQILYQLREQANRGLITHSFIQDLKQRKKRIFHAFN